MHPQPVELSHEPFRTVWATWLHNTQMVLFGHGSELVDQLGRASVTDGVATAERWLRWATESGILVREKNRPTREQMFSDANGDMQR
jgi:hypothetical protein